MKTAINEYNEINEEISNISNQIDLLKQNESVIKYLELEKQKSELLNKKRIAYINLRKNEYNCCDHLFVYSKVEFDGYANRACIKCGLDEAVLNMEKGFFSEEQRIMYDYLRDNYLKFTGTNTNILCDIDLAHAIYLRIKNNHPYMDDKQARKYFEIALNNIRNKNTSDYERTNKAKRLMLYPGFNRWYGENIYEN